jgi:hypothetical protein
MVEARRWGGFLVLRPRGFLVAHLRRLPGIGNGELWTGAVRAVRAAGACAAARCALEGVTRLQGQSPPIYWVVRRRILMLLDSVSCIYLTFRACFSWEKFLGSLF